MKRKRVILAVPQSRSGHTFLMNVLNAHPDVRITDEARTYRKRQWVRHFHFAKEQMQRYPRFKRAGQDSATRAIRGAFEHVAKKWPLAPLRLCNGLLSVYCIRALEDVLFWKERDKPGKVIGDKGYLPLPPPSHDRAMSIEEALDLFPDMKVVLLYRDPRDTFTSQARTAWRLRGGKSVPDSDPPWHPTRVDDPWRLSIEWTQNMKRWLDLGTRCDDLTVCYETLMDQPKRVLLNIANFLGVRDCGEMASRFLDLVDFRDHIGYWRDVYPDMEEKMHPDIFPVMEQFGYKKGGEEGANS